MTTKIKTPINFKARFDEFHILLAKCNANKGYMQGLTLVEYNRLNSLHAYLLSSEKGKAALLGKF